MISAKHCFDKKSEMAEKGHKGGPHGQSISAGDPNLWIVGFSSPSCPLSLFPKTKTLPSSVTTAECSPPSTTCTIGRWVGDGARVVPQTLIGFRNLPPLAVGPDIWSAQLGGGDFEVEPNWPAQKEQITKGVVEES